jgi:uncharacterized protein (TIGR03435 family)
MEVQMATALLGLINVVSSVLSAQQASVRSDAAVSFELTPVKRNNGRAIAWTLAVAAACFMPRTASAQKFEVVSIRPNTSNDTRQDLGGAPGQMIGSNIPVWWLIRNAYQIDESELIGAPPWVFSDRYDIIGKMPTGATRDQVRPMVISLLQDRFGLVVRRDTRDLPVYALVAARSDKRPGPKLTRSSIENCGAARATERPCNMNVNSGRVRASGTQLSELAPLLSQYIGRRVFDRTGMPGLYDFELDFSPGLEAGGDNSTSLFTALQEQLGLKLESQSGPVEVIVVQQIRRPTEN